MFVEATSYNELATLQTKRGRVETEERNCAVEDFVLRIFGDGSSEHIFLSVIVRIMDALITLGIAPESVFVPL